MSKMKFLSFSKILKFFPSSCFVYCSSKDTFDGIYGGLFHINMIVGADSAVTNTDCHNKYQSTSSLVCSQDGEFTFMNAIGKTNPMMHPIGPDKDAIVVASDLSLSPNQRAATLVGAWTMKVQPKPAIV